MELEKLLSIPAVLVGLGLLYVGYFEQDELTLFFFVLLGISLILAGFALVMGHRKLPSAPIVLGRGSSELEASDETMEQTKKGPEKKEGQQLRHCTNCGAPILSAGKFCGTCGKVIK